MRTVLCAIALAIPAIPVVVFTQVPADSVSPRAKQLHDRAIVVDSHGHTTQRLIFDEAFDIGKRNPNGNIDISPMREGGLDALFFSIWVPSEVTGPMAVKRALDRIDAVGEAVRTHPHDPMLAITAADLRKAAADHKIAASSLGSVVGLSQVEPWSVQLPITLEVKQDVEVVPWDYRQPEVHRRLYLGRIHAAAFRLRRRQRFEMIKIEGEGQCWIRVAGKKYLVMSCPWLEGFSDHQADVFEVVAEAPGRKRKPR